MLVEGGMYGNYANVFVRSGIATRGNVRTIFFPLLCSVLRGNWGEPGDESEEEEEEEKGGCGGECGGEIG